MPSATDLSASTLVDQIRAWLSVLIEDGSVVELRVPDAGRAKVISGYFDDLERMADEATRLSGRHPGVYFTINPVEPALLARAANRTVEYAKSTTADHDVVRRLWLPIDLDPTRPAGISASDEEHERAIQRGRAIMAELRVQGWPDPLVMDSGNGCYLLYRIELPNDEGGRELVERVLKALAFRYDDEGVHVDTGIGNAARIMRVPGTMNRKGDNVPERPHRPARVLFAPAECGAVPKKLLDALAGAAPTMEGDRPHLNGHGGAFELESFIDRYLEVARHGSWGSGGYRWILRSSPMCEHHGDGPYVVRHAGGAISAGCHHNSCAWGWTELRAKLEPNASRPVGGTALREVAASHDDLMPGAAPWPSPIAEEAFHGLAGDIVRKIEPNTEADPVALLLQFLVYFGNCAGRQSHQIIEADRHGLNEYVAIVGETSKARKGTSESHIRLLFSAVAGDWKTRIKTGLSSGEGLTWQIRDEVEGRDGKIEDEGEPDKRLLVVQRELAEVLRRMEREGNSLSSTLRDAFDGLPLASLVKHSPGRCEEPHVSVVGHITRDELTRYLTRTEAANGLGNRFLWACVRRARILPRGGGRVDLRAEEQRLTEAVAFAAGAGVLTLSEPAWQVFEAVYEPLSEGKPGLLGAMIARAEAHVRRLAAIYAVLDQSRRIEVPHLLAALAVWDYCEASARFIFGDTLGDPDADQVLEALRAAAPAGVTADELREHFQRNWPSSRRARALSSLITKGMVRAEKGVPGERGGRPPTTYYATVTPGAVSAGGYLALAKTKGGYAVNAGDAETRFEEPSQFKPTSAATSNAYAETSLDGGPAQAVGGREVGEL